MKLEVKVEFYFTILYTYSGKSFQNENVEPSLWVESDMKCWCKSKKSSNLADLPDGN